MISLFPYEPVYVCLSIFTLHASPVGIYGLIEILHENVFSKYLSHDPVDCYVILIQGPYTIHN